MELALDFPPFENKAYQAFLMVNTDGNRQDWQDWRKWSQFYCPMDQLVSLTKLEAEIKTSQTMNGPQVRLNFGKLKWSEKNNHKAMTQYANEPDLVFHDYEVWSPNRVRIYPKSGKGTSPLLYIKWQENHASNVQGLLIAIERELYVKHSDFVNDLIETLKVLIQPEIVMKNLINWAESYETKSGSMSNPLNFCDIRELYKSGLTYADWRKF